jgi:hypothetical protein
MGAKSKRTEKEGALFIIREQGRPGDKQCLHISNPKPEWQKKPLPLISSSQAAALGLPEGKPAS